jgi:hypothetical protein
MREDVTVGRWFACLQPARVVVFVSSAGCGEEEAAIR